MSCRAQPGADASGTGKSPPMPAARSEIVESRRDCRQRDNDLRCIIHQRSDLGFCVPESVPSRFAAGLKSIAPGRRPGRENIGVPTVLMRQDRVGDRLVPGLYFPVDRFLAGQARHHLWSGLPQVPLIGDRLLTCERRPGCTRGSGGAVLLAALRRVSVRRIANPALRRTLPCTMAS